MTDQPAATMALPPSSTIDTAPEAGDVERSTRAAPLVFGAAFVTIGLVGLLGDTDADFSWVAIAILGSLGLAGLLAAIAPVVRRGERPSSTG